MATGLSKPHDKFFKAVLAEPKAVSALFRERLPSALAAQLADRPPRLVEGSFISPMLRELYSDRLYKLALKGGGRLFVYCLVEHKSTAEPRVALQLLRYLVEVWEQLARQTTGTLPQVVPMLVYHGEKPWTVGPYFQALVDQGARPGVRPLDFEMVVVDLGAIEDDALSANPRLRAGLMGLKYATRELSQSRGLGAFLEALTAAPSLISQALSSIIVAYRQVDRALLLEKVRRVMPEYEEELLSKAAREWLAEGRAQGRQEGQAQGRQEGRSQGRKEGHAEGRQEGRVEARVQILERRFGPLPATARERVTAGSSTDLDGWLDRALDATSLDEFFGPPH